MEFVINIITETYGFSINLITLNYKNDPNANGIVILTVAKMLIVM